MQENSHSSWSLLVKEQHGGETQQLPSSKMLLQKTNSRVNTKAGKEDLGQALRQRGSTLFMLVLLFFFETQEEVE